MLDLIILVFLVIHVGIKAKRKRQNVLKWRLLTVAAWLGAEFVGLLIGIAILGVSKEAFLNIMIIALVSAFGGYLIVKYNLDKYPDQSDMEDDIDRIGQ